MHQQHFSNTFMTVLREDGKDVELYTLRRFSPAGCSDRTVITISKIMLALCFEIIKLHIGLYMLLDHKNLSSYFVRMRCDNIMLIVKWKNLDHSSSINMISKAFIKKYCAM